MSFCQPLLWGEKLCAVRRAEKGRKAKAFGLIAWGCKVADVAKVDPIFIHWNHDSWQHPGSQTPFFSEGVVRGVESCKVKKLHEKAECSHAKSAKGLRRLRKAQNSKGKRHNTILSTTKIPPHPWHWSERIPNEDRAKTKKNKKKIVGKLWLRHVCQGFVFFNSPPRPPALFFYACFQNRHSFIPPLELVSLKQIKILAGITIDNHESWPWPLLSRRKTLWNLENMYLPKPGVELTLKKGGLTSGGIT